MPKIQGESRNTITIICMVVYYLRDAFPCDGTILTHRDKRNKSRDVDTG